MVSDVIMQKYAKDMKSKWFRKCLNTGLYVACKANEVGKAGETTVHNMSWEELPKDALRCQPITFSDLNSRFKKPICIVKPEDLEEYRWYSENYGTGSSKFI